MNNWKVFVEVRLCPLVALSCLRLQRLSQQTYAEAFFVVLPLQADPQQGHTTADKGAKQPRLFSSIASSLQGAAHSKLDWLVGGQQRPVARASAMATIQAQAESSTPDPESQHLIPATSPRSQSKARGLTRAGSHHTTPREVLQQALRGVWLLANPLRLAQSRLCDVGCRVL